MAPALVVIVVVAAAGASGWRVVGGRVALCAAMAAVAVAAVLDQPVMAEAGYWVAAGTLVGASAAAVFGRVARRFTRSEQDW